MNRSEPSVLRLDMLFGDFEEVPARQCAEVTFPEEPRQIVRKDIRIGLSEASSLENPKALRLPC